MIIFFFFLFFIFFFFFFFFFFFYFIIISFNYIIYINYKFINSLYSYINIFSIIVLIDCYNYENKKSNNNSSSITSNNKKNKKKDDFPLSISSLITNSAPSPPPSHTHTQNQIPSPVKSNKCSYSPTLSPTDQPITPTIPVVTNHQK